MDKQKLFSTTDLGLAAFLKLRGLILSRVDRSTPHAVTFEFDDELDVCEQLRMEYVNSDFYKFNGELRGMKKLVHG
ncbi:MAG: DUF5659 domain-containing protein [Patescibacteria group bacterium]